jgi:hypothetical protein
VYDQYGNLSFVIPPKADDSTISEVLNGLYYQYKYDSRNRLVEKKLPGKQWEFIVYDKLDRVVATGPVNAPFKDFIIEAKQGWVITKYDKFNRVILTGWKDITSRVSLQSEYNNAAVLSETKTTTNNSTTVNNVSFNYTTLAVPTSGYHILTVNYYDNYDYSEAPTDFTVMLDNGDKGFYNNTTHKTKGLPTGSWVRVLENSSDRRFEISYTLYDKKPDL